LADAILAALESATLSAVILTGPAKSGKSRTLFEVLRQVAPEAVVIAPATRDALVALLYESGPPVLEAEVPIVLWLDDIELFIARGQDGLSVESLDVLRDWPRPTIIVGTAGGITATGQGEAFSQPISDFLRQPLVDEVLQMSGRLTADDERDCALALYPTGIAHDLSKGVGEFMIAGADLLRKHATGQHVPGASACLMGQRVAEIVIDWARSGGRRALSEEEIGEQCRRAGIADADCESGLRWGARPLYETMALLQRDGEGYRALDYVVRALERPATALTRERWAEVALGTTGEDAFNMGVSAFNRAWFEEAERSWRIASETGSGGGGQLNARANLGAALAAQDRWAEAEEVWIDAARAGSGAAAYQLAKKRFDDARYDEARDLGRQALSLGERWGAIPLGLALVALGQFDAAEDPLRQADEAGIGVGSFHLGLLLATHRKDYQQAVELFSRALSRGVRDAEGLRGAALAELGKLDHAQRDWERSAERGDPSAIASLARLAFVRNDPEEGTRLYLEAETLGYPAASFYLGRELQMRRDFEGAREAFARSAAKGHIPSITELAHVLNQLGDPEQAESLLRQADEAGDIVATVNLGIMMSNVNRRREAERLWERAAAAGHRGGFFHLGMLRAIEGNTPEAERLWQLAIDRGHRVAAIRLGESLERRREYLAALNAYQRALDLPDDGTLDLSGDDPRARMLELIRRVARRHELLDETDSAIEWYERGIGLGDAGMAREAERVMRGLGQDRQADRYRQQAEELD
jgi:tetratricopeptide (TPR) repeat protein